MIQPAIKSVELWETLLQWNLTSMYSSFVNHFTTKKELMELTRRDLVHLRFDSAQQLRFLIERNKHKSETQSLELEKTKSRLIKNESSSDSKSISLESGISNIMLYKCNIFE